MPVKFFFVIVEREKAHSITSALHDITLHYMIISLFEIQSYFSSYMYVFFSHTRVSFTDLRTMN